MNRKGLTEIGTTFMLINGRECMDLQKRGLEAIANGWSSFAVEYGTAKLIGATGRSRCRCCGYKIKKGESSWKFPYDFTGSGSWTCVDSQIHNLCKPYGDSGGSIVYAIDLLTIS